MPPWARPTLFRGRPGKLKIFLKHPLDREKTLIKRLAGRRTYIKGYSQPMELDEEVCF
jgi:hypothetical protein